MGAKKALPWQKGIAPILDHSLIHSAMAIKEIRRLVVEWVVVVVVVMGLVVVEFEVVDLDSSDAGGKVED